MYKKRKRSDSKEINNDKDNDINTPKPTDDNNITEEYKLKEYYSKEFNYFLIIYYAKLVRLEAWGYLFEIENDETFFKYTKNINETNQTIRVRASNISIYDEDSQEEAENTDEQYIFNYVDKNKISETMNINCNIIEFNKKIRNKPSSNEEAIARAAIYFNFDISYANSPVEEYKYLCIKPYIPKDIEIKNRNEHDCREIYNPHFECCLNIYLPGICYNINLLIKFCNENGIKIDNTIDIFSKIQDNILKENFFDGPMINIFNRRSIYYLEDYNTEENNKFVFYGIPKSKIFFCTFQELYYSFKNKTNFINFIDPINKELFNEETINKLKIICSKKLYKNFIKNDIECPNIIFIKNLLLEIEKIELFTTTMNRYELKIKKEYSEFIESDKNYIKTIMDELWNMCCFIRGNKNDENIDFILTSVQTDEDFVESKVIEYMLKHEKKREENKSLINFVENFNIYSIISSKFVKNNDKEYGLKLKDRIELIKKGNLTNNINSCIRLTSNYILYTLYFYYNNFELVIPHDIKIINMRNIQ